MTALGADRPCFDADRPGTAGAVETDMRHQSHFLSTKGTHPVGKRSQLARRHVTALFVDDSLAVFLEELALLLRQQIERGLGGAAELDAFR